MVFKFTKRTGKNINHFQVTLTEITEKKLKVKVNVPSKSFYYTTL